MRLDRTLIVLTTGGLLVALATGCASPAKQMKSQTDLIDGTSAQAAALPSRAEPAPVTPAPEPAVAACDISRVHFAFDSATLDEAAWSQNRRAELKQQGEKRTDGVTVSLR